MAARINRVGEFVQTGNVRVDGNEPDLEPVAGAGCIASLAGTESFLWGRSGVPCAKSATARW